jgi:hypothetical protein
LPHRSASCRQAVLLRGGDKAGNWKSSVMTSSLRCNLISPARMQNLSSP